MALLNSILSTGMPFKEVAGLFPESGFDKLTMEVNKNCKK